MNFLNLSYLQNGSAIQQRIFKLLTRHKIMRRLQAFDPILTGTFPLGIDIETSDLDVICRCENPDAFFEKIQQEFAHENHFSIKKTSYFELPAVVAHFEIGGFEVEIFGQNKATQMQDAYRHMRSEYAILQQHGAAFREAVIALKRQGLKTEAAFGQLLGLSNPYEELRDYRP